MKKIITENFIVIEADEGKMFEQKIISYDIDEETNEEIEIIDTNLFEKAYLPLSSTDQDIQEFLNNNIEK